MYFFNTRERKQFNKMLASEYGATRVPDGVFARQDRDVFLSTLEAAKLSRQTRCDTLGMRFGTYDHDLFILSIEGAQLIQGTKTIELTSAEFSLWLQGKAIEAQHEKGAYVITHAADVVGAAQCKNGMLKNSLPSQRVLKHDPI